MKMFTSLSKAFLIFTIVTAFCKQFVSSRTYTSIFWTEFNNIFDEGQGEQCINVIPQSNLLVICPFQGLVLKTRDDEISSQQLYENFIMVDKHGYDNCVYDKTKPRNTTRFLWKCDNPLALRTNNLIFTTFSASSDGLEFSPGNYYYFISTADGIKDSLNSTSGGHCNGKTNRLKLKVYVCYNQQDCDDNTECSLLPQNSDIDAIMAKRTGGKEQCSLDKTLIIVIVTLAILLVVALGLLAAVLRKNWKKAYERKKERKQNGTSKHTNPITNGNNELNNIKKQKLPKGSESSYPFIDKV